LKPIEFAPRARRDLDRLLEESEQRLGPAVADRYRRLVAAALRDLRLNSARSGVHSRLELREDLRLNHLRHSRLRPSAGQRIARVRHFIVFREVDGGLVIVRVLHDAMDLQAHP